MNNKILTHNSVVYFAICYSRTYTLGNDARQAVTLAFHDSFKRFCYNNYD